MRWGRRWVWCPPSRLPLAPRGAPGLVFVAAALPGEAAAGCTAVSAQGPSSPYVEASVVADTDYWDRQRKPACRRPRIAAAGSVADTTAVLPDGRNPAAARPCKSSLL